MTYLAIGILAIMALLGGIATANHDWGGTPFLVIGVLGLAIILGKRFFPHRTTGGEGGE